MHSAAFNPIPGVRQYRSINAVLVFLLLWAAIAFALHTHHDDPFGHSHHAECQICLYATLGHAPVPEATKILAPFLLLDSVYETLPENLFVRPQLRIQQARAPPFIS
jgi:hypothetical protein